eukprot:4257538-Pyramimonas_sp.AAC.1
MRRSDSRLPRRDGDYHLLDLLSLRLVRRFCDRSLPVAVDVPSVRRRANRLRREYRAALAA